MKKDSNMALLKFLSIIGVIVIHVSAQYLDATYTIKSFHKLYTYHLGFSNFINCIVRFAVPCFFMISGAYLLNNDKNKVFKTFYKRKIPKLIICLICFSLFYLGYNIIIEKYTIKEGLTKLLNGSIGYHLWFIYAIVLMYLLTPLIINLKKVVSDKAFFYTGIGLLAISYLPMSKSPSVLWDIGTNIYYLGYFLIGYYIKKNVKKKDKKRIMFSLLIFIISFTVNSFIQLNNFKTSPNHIYVFKNYSNFFPLIIIGSISMFYLFNQITIKKDLKIINYINNYSLYIYLIHPFIISLTYYILHAKYIIIDPIYMIPYLTIISFITSLIISIIGSKIYQLTKKLLAKKS